MRAFTCVLAGVAAFVFAASATAAIPKTCPPASVVGATLGVSAKTPTKTTSGSFVTCKYGTAALAPRVEFQMDSLSSFDGSEKAVKASEPITVVKHLGKAAWGTKSGGLLEVFTGSYTIKILAPLTPLTKLEALAHKLL